MIQRTDEWDNEKSAENNQKPESLGKNVNDNTNIKMLKVRKQLQKKSKAFKVNNLTLKLMRKQIEIVMGRKTCHGQEEEGGWCYSRRGGVGENETDQEEG